MTNKRINTICLATLIFLIIFGYSYLLIGAWYSHPNAEDLALSAKPLHFGVIHSIKQTLLTYDGRYFTNVLHALNPIALGWLNAYKWQTIFTILILPLSLSFFIKNLIQNISYKKAFLFSITFCLINYSLSPSLPHQIYWMVSSFVYTYCWVLWFFWVGFYLNFIKTKSHISFTLALILLILSNGINEMFLIINGATMIILFIVNYSKKIIYHPIASLIFTYVISTFFFLSNPGIIIRFNSFNNDRIQASESNIVIKSFMDFITETSSWFTKELMFISFLVFTTFFLKKELKNWSEKFTINQIYLISFLALFSIYSSSYAFYIPMGFEEDIPYRIYTSIDLGVQLLLCISIPILLIKYFENKIFKFATPTIALLSVISIFTATLIGSNNINLLKKEFNNNTLSRFSESMNLRYSTIEDSKINYSACWKVAKIQEINNPPKSISNPPDILSNKATYYWNNAYEKYFLIDEIRLNNDTIYDLTLIKEYNE